MGKRAFDVTLALFLLVPLALVLPAVAVLIVVVDRRLPFYLDRRAGLDGRTFACIKFRTMSGDPRILDAYFAAHPAEELRYITTRKLLYDPRVSALGNILRRTSVDELPQLLNILFGQMSFIGPRPLSRAEWEARGHRRWALSSVRPGLTGLWQVSGRSDTTVLRRAALDHYYATRWSPRLDLAILVLTPLVVLRSTGAR